MYYKIIIKILLLLLLVFTPLQELNRNSNFQVNINKPVLSLLVPYFLIPLTKQEDLIKCSDIINEVENFRKAIECTVDQGIFTREQVKHITELPPCFIIMETSADVKSYLGIINYISFSIFSDIKILGFYIPYNHVIYIVNNPDTLEFTYIHEVQHYILNLIEKNADAAHVHDIWQKCQP